MDLAINSGRPPSGTCRCRHQVFYSVYTYIYGWDTQILYWTQALEVSLLNLVLKTLVRKKEGRKREGWLLVCKLVALALLIDASPYNQTLPSRNTVRPSEIAQPVLSIYCKILNYELHRQDIVLSLNLPCGRSADSHREIWLVHKRQLIDRIADLSSAVNARTFLL
jgi:hypothetical protein